MFCCTLAFSISNDFCSVLSLFQEHIQLKKDSEKIVTELDEIKTKLRSLDEEIKNLEIEKTKIFTEITVREQKTQILLENITAKTKKLYFPKKRGLLPESLTNHSSIVILVGLNQGCVKEHCGGSENIKFMTDIEHLNFPFTLNDKGKLPERPPHLILFG